METALAFGIELAALRNEDLPLLMSWRNHPDVLPFMEDTRKITLDGLKFWHSRIKKQGNTFAYIAYSQAVPVAYTELKNVNQTDNSYEDGLILFGKQYRGTGLSDKIMLCRETVSARLGIQTMMNRIHFKNEASIYFYKKYGAELMGQEGDFLLFRYEYEKRRLCMEKMAIQLGLHDEYTRYLI